MADFNIDNYLATPPAEKKEDFNIDKYLAKGKPDGADKAKPINIEPFKPAQAFKPTETGSSVAANLKGVSGLFGVGPKIGAAFVTAKDHLLGHPTHSFGDDYGRNLRELDQAYEGLDEVHPIPGKIGNLTGMAADLVMASGLPILKGAQAVEGAGLASRAAALASRVGATGATGAAYAGAQGALASRKDGVAGHIEDAWDSAKEGFTTGAALHGLGEGVSKFLSRDGAVAAYIRNKMNRAKMETIDKEGSARGSYEADRAARFEKEAKDAARAAKEEAALKEATKTKPSAEMDTNGLVGPEASPEEEIKAAAAMKPLTPEAEAERAVRIARGKHSRDVNEAIKLTGHQAQGNVSMTPQQMATAQERIVGRRSAAGIQDVDAALRHLDDPATQVADVNEFKKLMKTTANREIPKPPGAMSAKDVESKAAELLQEADKTSGGRRSAFDKGARKPMGEREIETSIGEPEEFKDGQKAGPLRAPPGIPVNGKMPTAQENYSRMMEWKNANPPEAQMIKRGESPAGEMDVKYPDIDTDFQAARNSPFAPKPKGAINAAVDAFSNSHNSIGGMVKGAGAMLESGAPQQSADRYQRLLKLVSVPGPAAKKLGAAFTRAGAMGPASIKSHFGGRDDARQP